MPASTATTMPTITWLTIAAVFPSKPRFHGATIAHRPSRRLAHSSHSVNAINAAIATSAISAPTIHAFHPAVVWAKPEEPRCHEQPRAKDQIHHIDERFISPFLHLHGDLPSRRPIPLPAQIVENL